MSETTISHPSFTLLDQLNDRLQQVETLLDAQFNGETNLMLALRQLLNSGGKRIRPRLVLLTGSLLGADPRRLVPLAAAVEMLHTATLIHDDLIDGAALRRGMETLNMEWSPAATVLAGDFAFTRSAGLAAAADSIPIMRMFSESMSVMVNGELTHLLRNRGATSQQEYFRWISAKTATLFELATGSAAILGVEENAIAPAKRFGHELGMAFQIMDDILDFTGDPDILGKPVGSDLRQGVLTLPSLYYIESHPDSEEIFRLIEHGFRDDQMIEQVIANIRRSDAMPRALAEAQNFVQRGLEALANLPIGPERFSLEEIARGFVERKS